MRVACASAKLGRLTGCQWHAYASSLLFAESVKAAHLQQSDRVTQVTIPERHGKPPFQEHSKAEDNRVGGIHQSFRTTLAAGERSQGEVVFQFAVESTSQVTNICNSRNIFLRLHIFPSASDRSLTFLRCIQTTHRLYSCLYPMADMICLPMAHASKGGTALPTCTYLDFRFPENAILSGRLCARAHSLTLRTLSCSG